MEMYHIQELKIITYYQCSLKIGNVLRPENRYVLSHADKRNSHLSHPLNIFIQFKRHKERTALFYVSHSYY